MRVIKKLILIGTTMAVALCEPIVFASDRLPTPHSREGVSQDINEDVGLFRKEMGKILRLLPGMQEHAIVSDSMGFVGLVLATISFRYYMIGYMRKAAILASIAFGLIWSAYRIHSRYDQIVPQSDVPVPPEHARFTVCNGERLHTEDEFGRSATLTRDEKTGIVYLNNVPIEPNNQQLKWAFDRFLRVCLKSS